jgi:lycopene cyclase domain-containing protein
MIYAMILLVFGILPILVFWKAAPWIVRSYKGTLFVIVILILTVSIPWEMLAINRIWYYSPVAIWGLRLLDLPVEELAFYLIDGLLVGTLAIFLGEKFRDPH